MNKSSQLSAGRKQAGFTLIEVLVAMVILALGLLGVAGLQATSMRNAHSGYLRSQATILAYDIVDRMRANVSQARLGAYNVALGASVGSGQGLLCGVQGAAANDVTEWKDCLAYFLPGGDGSVTVDLTNTAIIVVRWQEKLAAAGGGYTMNTVSFTTRSKL